MATRKRHVQRRVAVTKHKRVHVLSVLRLKEVQGMLVQVLLFHGRDWKFALAAGSGGPSVCQGNSEVWVNASKGRLADP